MILTDYWKVIVLGYQKVLVLSFFSMGNTDFFSQNVDVKVMFTWSFWAFHDIPGPGEYEFSCSEIKADVKQLQDDIKETKDGFTPVTNQNVKGSAINNLLNLEKEHWTSIFEKE